MQENPFAVPESGRFENASDRAHSTEGTLSRPIAIVLTAFAGASVSTVLMALTFIPIVLVLHLVFGDEYGPGNYGQFGLVLITLLPFTVLSGACSCLLWAGKVTGRVGYAIAGTLSIALLDDVWLTASDNIACSVAFFANVAGSAFLHVRLIKVLRGSISVRAPRSDSMESITER